MNYNFKNSVIPGLIIVATLVPATVIINWYTAEIDSTKYFTLALVNALSVNCMPYFLFGLFGFAFSHTEKGKRIIMPINLSALAMFAMWITTYFYYAPVDTWSIALLDTTINTQLLLSFVVGSVPFAYFYVAGLITRQLEPAIVQTRSNP